MLVPCREEAKDSTAGCTREPTRFIRPFAHIASILAETPRVSDLSKVT